MASALDNHSKLAARLSMSGTRPAALDTFQLPFQPGEVIGGKYKIIRLIGTGGVGFVVSARHVGFDEVVALKFLRPEFATHTEAVTRFTIEARASFKIKSEHVARVLDVDTLPDGTPFIAMELLEGTDMRRLLDRCRVLAIEPAVDYAIQTCEALASAHGLHIIHRDIKPENLFLTGFGADTDQVKVLDFGISKVALTGNRPQTHQALTRVAVGTPPYMSPEQVRASNDLDARSDIWSVGCVLYDLWTGTAPFDRLSLLQSCAAVLAEEPVPARALRPAVSSDLEAVVMRCLQKEPAARYQDVAELAEALAPFGSSRLANYPERCRAALCGALNGDASGRRSTPSNVAPRRATAMPLDTPMGLSNSALRRLTGAQRAPSPGDPMRRLPTGVGASAPLTVPASFATPATINDSYTRARRQPSNLRSDLLSARPTLLLPPPAPTPSSRWHLRWPAAIAFGVGAALAFGGAYWLAHNSAVQAVVHRAKLNLPSAQAQVPAPIATPQPALSPAPLAQPRRSQPTTDIVQPPLAVGADVLPEQPLPSSAAVLPAAVVEGGATSATLKPKPKSRSTHLNKPTSANRPADEPDVGF